MKSGVTSTALTLGQHGSAHRGSQPGEQLVHAERLGEVVVGAEVEGLDLGGLGAAARQHDDRDRRPAAQAAHDVEPVHAGQAEIEDHGVGMVAGGELERVLAGAGQIDLVATGAEVDVERLQDADVVVDDQTRGSRRHLQADHDRRATTGRVVDRDGAVHRVDESLRHRETEPDAVVGRPPAVAEALERLEHRLALIAGDAGAPVDDAEVDAVAGDDAASTRTRVPSGAQLTALRTTFATARSSSAGSAITSGRSSGTSTSTVETSTDKLASAA